MLAGANRRTDSQGISGTACIEAPTQGVSSAVSKSEQSTAHLVLLHSQTRVLIGEHVNAGINDRT